MPSYLVCGATIPGCLEIQASLLNNLAKVFIVVICAIDVAHDIPLLLLVMRVHHLIIILRLVLTLYDRNRANTTSVSSVIGCSILYWHSRV